MANEHAPGEQLIQKLETLTSLLIKHADKPIAGVVTKEALAYTMVTGHVAMASEAARHGDWEGAAKRLLDMSNAALIVASGGTLGIAECAYDATAAALTASGVPAPTFTDWAQTFAKDAGGVLGDIAWGTLHQDQFPSHPVDAPHLPDPADAGASAGAPEPVDAAPIDLEVDAQNHWVDTRTGETGGPDASAAAHEAFDPGSPHDAAPLDPGHAGTQEAFAEGVHDGSLHDAGAPWDPGHDGSGDVAPDGGLTGDPLHHDNQDAGQVHHADFDPPPPPG